MDSDALKQAKRRLKHSELDFDQKHAFIFPAYHVAVRLFVESKHKANNQERTQ